MGLETHNKSEDDLLDEVISLDELAEKKEKEINAIRDEYWETMSRYLFNYILVVTSLVLINDLHGDHVNEIDKIQNLILYGSYVVNYMCLLVAHYKPKFKHSLLLYSAMSISSA